MMTYRGLFTKGVYGGRWNLNFSLQKSDRVLDLGGGVHVYPYATDVIDKVEANEQRYNSELQIGERKLWNGYAEEILPTVPNKFFDFVYSSHTLEHAEDLPFVLKELTRTCKRGFLIVPHYYMDVWSNGKESYHNWLFAYDHQNDILQYRKRLPHEFYETLCSIQPQALDWRNRVAQGHDEHFYIRALWEIRCYWEDSIESRENPQIFEESLYMNEKVHWRAKC